MECLICKRLITTTYYVDWRGNNVCKECYDRGVAPQCTCCWQFCDEHAIQVAPKQYLCPVCQQRIITQKDCGHVVDYIRKHFANTPIQNIPRYRLFVADTKTLLEGFPRGSENLRGYASMRGKDYMIHVYRHLSRVGFADVLSHEMLHLWQYEKRINPPSFYCEGFCNLGSYTILQKINVPEAQYRVKVLCESPDPIYGEGLRYMLEIYKRSGWQGAIDELRRHRK